MTAAPPSDAPVFERVDARLLLYALSSSGEAAVPGFWAGYLAGADLGGTASLGDVWRDPGGSYLFCGRGPDDPGRFADDLGTVLVPGIRFLWIADPTAPVWTWTTFRLPAASSGGGDSIAWRVPRRASFGLGRYSVDIAPGATLTPSGAGYGVAIADGFVELVAPGGVYQAGSAWLPLAGGQLGAWVATVGLDHGGDGAPDDMARLGVQLRYAVPGTEPGTILPVPTPILVQRGTSLTAYLSFDPLYPLLPVRTAVSFFPSAGGAGAGSQGPLRSSLRTALGYQVHLTPLRPEPPLWAARLAFCYTAAYTDAGGGYQDYYLAPDGAFALGVDGPDTRLLLGLSGTEYAELGPGAAAMVLFQAGRPAYAPAAVRREPGAEPVIHSEDNALTGRATTAYLTLLPAAGTRGLTYYAQPQRSPWYAAGAGSARGFLDSLPLPTATLPAPGPAGTPPALPMAGWAGLDPSLAATARVLEAAALAPARRKAIADAGDTAAAQPETVRVVTPQGLVADVAAGSTPQDSRWYRVILASFPGSQVSELAFTGVGPKLRAALQASELFFVVADREEYMDDSSVRYRLDQVALDVLRGQLPKDVCDALVPLADRLYETEDDFVAALPATALPHEEPILHVAGALKAAVEDWTFQLSPRSWRTAAQPTMMLVKYSGRSLAELAADLPVWGWPRAAGTDQKATQKLLCDMLDAAAESPPDSPYARFYREVAADPAWNGVLFLNAPVAAADLPKDLQFVTAGVDQKGFYAHHVGFSLTSIQVASGQISLGQTAALGLLHYEDLADLVLEADTPLAFKTQRLSVRFAGGVIADLSAQVELMVNRLFGDQLTMLDPDHGNNLVLAGGYQRQNGVPSYAFALTMKSAFALSRSVLDSVEVLTVGLRTATGSVAQGRAAVEFELAGNLRFAELPRFDLFSYGPQYEWDEGEEPADGYLKFSGLVVRMEFDYATPDEHAFTVDEGRIAIDLPASQARPGSLADGFPVNVSGLVAVQADPGEPAHAWEPAHARETADDTSPGQRPEDLGYAGVLAPIEAVPLKPPWYGLTMTLDLGTLGALAGAAGITATLLAAWAPGKVGDAADERPVYLGLQLATTGSTWPVQGVLRLGFRAFEFLTAEEGSLREYLLRLSHLTLSVLGWSVPPGNLDVILFGDPDPGPDRGRSLGWYAAYPQTPSGPAGSARESLPTARLSGPAARRLRSGRRALPPATGLRRGSLGDRERRPLWPG
jgi:hypothetical protein